jgi:hypothetical protein
MLTALGGSAFGWGNLTHVSLSRQLGVPIGALNMNELDLTLRCLRQQLLAHGIVPAAGPCLPSKGDPEFDLENPEVMAVAPAEFALDQNYPNPFNPSTRIKFQVPSSGFMSLKMYDVLGREVATLVNEELKAGSHEATFDATGLASGVYYYQLRAGEFTQTKRLLLLR